MSGIAYRKSKDDGYHMLILLLTSAVADNLAAHCDDYAHSETVKLLMVVIV